VKEKKKKIARYSTGEQVEKHKLDVEEIKRQLGDTKNENANNLKALRQKI